ncbi:MAG: hypothetical protein K9M45_07315 [Kiritimatiellales bacterium]|nr:hypothetical protein [Kiritimatiellales bacterium]
MFGNSLHLPDGGLYATIICMKKAGLIQQLSGHLFWDVYPEGVDPEKHRQFIIPRVMDRGTLADVEAVWNYYGEEKVRAALLSASSLNKKTIAFFANQFNLPRENFRAYRESSKTWNQ